MQLFFYIFSALITLGAIGVVASRNPVYSVMWLIFTFLNSAGIFLLLNAEFIAMTIIIVYVGAVAVLFLFIVMMIDIDTSIVKQKLKNTSFLAIGIIIILLMEMILLVRVGLYNNMPEKADAAKIMIYKTNTHSIGEVLYSNYFMPFQLCGVVLLIAMIGCIVITLRKRPGVKRQDPSVQSARTQEESIMLIDVKKGMGINGNVKY